MIWGTDVNVGTCKEKFQVRPPLCPGFSQSGRWLLKGNRGLFCLQRFLQRFVDPTSSEDENAGLDLNEPLYMQKLEEVRSDERGPEEERPREPPPTLVFLLFSDRSVWWATPCSTSTVCTCAPLTRSSTGSSFVTHRCHL